MEITEIRVKFANREGDRLKAYCSVTFDAEFVVRDVRIVEGTNGLFVAMPSRKISAACPRCNHKNPSLGKFCSECGARLPAPAMTGENGARVKLHRDIAHPITPAFRQMLHERIIEAYLAECEKAKDPDYEPKPMDEEEPEAVEPVVVGDEEPEEERMQDGVNEYDALIADLRGRGADGDRRDGDRGQPRRPARPPTDGRRSGDERPRSRDGGAVKKPPMPQRGTPGTSRASSPPERPQPKKRAPERPQPIPRAAATEDGTMLVEKPAPAARPAPAFVPPKERSPEPPPPARKVEPAPVAAEDDDLPFGAGLL